MNMKMLSTKHSGGKSKAKNKDGSVEAASLVDESKAGKWKCNVSALFFSLNGTDT
jgi:hypothetical protein